jgi:hypothetical protein
MRPTSLILAAVSLSPLILGMSGCASHLIEVKPGSDHVSVADASQVTSCKYVGKTTVMVLSQVGIFSRSIEDVDANLLQLARNDAVDEGGDTIVKGERPEIGKRTFEIYQCHH